MKKMYVIVATLLSLPVAAQVTFEEQVLSPESFTNDAGGGGAFVFNGISLSNYYDAGWDFWTGFSISNITDNTTAGFGNQYSAYPGSGNNASEKYAVYYPTGSIVANSGQQITSFAITNTTYAALAMRDGDSYSKQFGSIYNANGDVDGTNGEDFLRVWIIGSDEAATQRDSFAFYLADYRFPDPQDDYIVEQWESLDLTVFSFPVAQLEFLFESSDVGAFGINTPTYFALDDIAFANAGLNAVEAASWTVYPNPVVANVHVEGGSGILRLEDLTGKVLFEQEHEGSSTINFDELANGAYRVVLTAADGTQTSKTILK